MNWDGGTEILLVVFFKSVKVLKVCVISLDYSKWIGLCRTFLLIECYDLGQITCFLNVCDSFSCTLRCRSSSDGCGCHAGFVVSLDFLCFFRLSSSISLYFLCWFSTSPILMFVMVHLSKLKVILLLLLKFTVSVKECYFSWESGYSLRSSMYMICNNLSFHILGL